MANEILTRVLPQELGARCSAVLAVSQSPASHTQCPLSPEAASQPNSEQLHDERDVCELAFYELEDRKLAVLVRYRLAHLAPLVMVPWDEL